MSRFAGFLVMLLALSLPSRATEWQMDAANSSILFTGQQAGVDFTGHFNRFTLNVNFDPSAPEDGSIRADIDLSSVDAGSIERTQALPGEDWFFVKSFPTAIFRSTAIRSAGENSYLAEGVLSLRGISQAITLAFDFDQNGDTAIVTAHHELDRSQFGVGTGVWTDEKWVGHLVRVDIKVTARNMKVTSP